MTAVKQPVKSLTADKTCKLAIRDGKVWCDTHNVEHIWSTEWSYHDGHGHKTRLPFKHVLYSGTLCPCGVIIIDQEQ